MTSLLQSPGWRTATGFATLREYTAYRVCIENSQPPKLKDALPTLAHDLRESLVREGESHLVEQVEELRVHALCACGEEGCLGVYLEPERDTPCGDYRVVLPDAVVSLGVCEERLDWIDDNELVSLAGSDPRRRSEYEALRPDVPGRLPIPG